MADKNAAAPPRRNAAIDLVRAFSILWIVGLWHLFDYLPDLPGAKNDVTYRATVALLGLFVLVSGYLMGLKDVPLKPRPLRDFYLGRFGRIYPPFVLACLLFALFKLADVASLVKAALLVAMLWGPAPFTLWFIAMIALFYAVTPLLMAARRNGWTFGLVIAALTVLAALAHLQWPTVSPRLAMYLPSYCVGLWLAAHAVSWRQVLIFGLVAALPALAVSMQADTRMIESSLFSIPWALAMSAALFGAAMAGEGSLPRWGWILFVAQASYFLYLFHRPVYALVLKVYDPAGWEGRAALIVLLALPVAIVAAWIGQRIYDRIWAGFAPARTHLEGKA